MNNPKVKKGSIVNRDQFLGSIANKLRRPKRIERIVRPERNHRPEVKVLQDLSADELLEVFIEESKHIHTDVLETTQANLSDDLITMLKDHGDGSIIVPKDDRFKQYNLDALFEKESVYTWDVDKGEQNIIEAERAQTGIMFSDVTLAESATVVLYNDEQIARSISLLPETFIAIIPKSTLVPRFTQIAAQIDEQVRNGELVASCVNFISGPSNSADIEYNLVVGVHGPVKASYIVVTDL